MPQYGLRVQGLKEFRRDLKRVDSASGPAIRQANKTVAEVVAGQARGNAQSQPRQLAARPRPSRQHWGDYVASFRALASQTRAQVALGSTRLPWALGQNFGSPGRYRQFPGQGNPDHAMYLAIGATVPQQMATFAAEYDKLSKIAFPDPPGGA